MPAVLAEVAMPPCKHSSNEAKPPPQVLARSSKSAESGPNAQIAFLMASAMPNRVLTVPVTRKPQETRTLPREVADDM